MKSKDRTHNSNRRYASDDEADSLLADIMSETAEVANEEQAELERAIAAKRQAAEQAKAEEHARRLAERQRKLEAELERQRALADKRTQKMKALTAPAQPESAAALSPESDDRYVDADSIRKEIEEELRREFRDIANTPMPEPVAAPRKATTHLWVMAAAIILASGAGVVAFATQSYKPDANAYAKSVFAPADRSIVAMEVGYVPIPAAEAVPTPKEEIVAERPKPRPKPRPQTKPTSKPKPSPFSTPKQNDANKRLSELDKILGSGADPFSAE